MVAAFDGSDGHSGNRLFFMAKPTIGLALAAAGDQRLQKIRARRWTRSGRSQLGLLPLMAARVAGSVTVRVPDGAALSSEVEEFSSCSRFFDGAGQRLACYCSSRASRRWAPGTRLVPVFLVPATSREAMILASVSSLGFTFQDHLMTARNETEYNQQAGAMIVALGYLPAVLMVLQRPNEGDPPWWLNPSGAKLKQVVR